MEIAQPRVSCVAVEIIYQQLELNRALLSCRGAGAFVLGDTLAAREKPGVQSQAPEVFSLWEVRRERRKMGNNTTDRVIILFVYIYIYLFIFILRTCQSKLLQLM